jgi:predicted regulator of Ras-like GTPase activity (Roadblock/LC7/MglB family)
MNFEPVLRRMIDGVSGAIGIALMGSDGIPVVEVRAQGAASGVSDAEGEGEAGAAGVEFGRVLEEIRKGADALGAGRLEEVMIGLAGHWLLFRTVDEELFLVAVLEPRANLGKARFLMRRHLLALQEQL